MKTFYLILGIATALLLNFSAVAQVQVGITAGVNLANFYGEHSDGGKIRPGLLAGGILHVPVSEKFALQPELLFAQQGTRGEGGGTTIHFNNNYLMLPLIGKIYLSPNFVLQAGPQLGLLLTSKIKGEENGVNGSVDSKELYRSIEFGLNAGLSSELPGGLVFTTRYSLGLTNVMDVHVVRVNSKNSAIQISLAYRFPLE